MAGHARRFEDEDDPAGHPAPPEVALVPVRTPPEQTPGAHAPPRPALPDPSTAARALGLCVVEVLTGGREVDSIARWITEDVHRHLLQRAALAARSRSLGGRTRTRPALRVGGVRVCEPAPGVAEAVVVVHTRSHARAVALRLEVRKGRWQATAVGVL